MPVWIRVFLSGLLAGIISGGGAFMAVATDLQPGAGLGDIGGVTWAVIGITILIAAAKDWKAYTAPPPVDTARKGGQPSPAT